MSEYVYVAGPMRGYPDFNFPAFFEAEQKLLEENPRIVVLNPARRDTQGGFDFAGTNGTEQDLTDQGFNLRDALAYDLQWICRHASRVHMLAGWTRSKGATAERAAALALGIEVTYDGRAEKIPTDYADGFDEGWSRGWDEAMRKHHE